MIDLLIKEDEKDLKNMGFIINEKTNTYTANIITVNGILTSSQHQCIGKAAELFGNGIIKLSTSFTIEVRGIPYEKINDFRKYIEKENIEESSESLSIFYRVIEWIINLLANHQGFLCVLLTIILVTTHGFCKVNPYIKLIGYLPLAIISTCIYFHDNQGNVKKNIGLFIIFIVLTVFSMHVILNLYHGEVFDFSPANIIANFVQVVTIMSILMTIAKKKYS